MTTATMDTKVRVSPRERIAHVEQAYLVLAITMLVALAGGLTTPNFLSFSNFTSILSLSAAFGILAVGEAVVILGKGIDLSVAGIGLGTAQATLAFMHRGLPEWQAVTLMGGLAVLLGVANGVLIAYFEVPALFATLATGMLAIGGIDILFLEQNVYNVPGSSLIAELSSGSVAGVPRPVLVAAAVFVCAWLFITYTSPGRLIRAMGDNFDTARATGAPVRPLQVLTYVIAAVLAVLAGYVAVSIQGSVQTTVTSFDPILFTALTVVVIGGISLSGGRGTILGVLAGSLFVGVLNNLLVLHGLSTAAQNLIRGAVLITAIAFDAWLHPRNVETEKSGEL